MGSACIGQSMLGGCAPWNRTAARWQFARIGCCAVLLWACLAVAPPARLEAEEPPAGSTSRQSREEAIRGIPFDSLTDSAKQKITHVVSNPSIFRRLPSKTIECDPEMYLFLVRYPEVVVNIWEIMGVTSVTMDRKGPYNFSANDGLGTVSDVELIYGDANTHVLYANGFYNGQGPLVRNPIQGRCVMLLRSSFAKTADDRVRVTSQLDVFVRIESTGIDLLARTLHPLLGRTADINFLESTKFLGRLSEAAASNGPGVQELATRLERVEPGVRTKFAEVAGNVHRRAVVRLSGVPIAETPAAEVRVAKASGESGE